MNPFSLESYAEILRLIKGQYVFVPTSKALQSPDLTGENKCILRHDIDYSLEHALNLARIENDHGIKSTYYFLLDSMWYNLLNPIENKKLKEISRLGHDIGLHFDAVNLVENKVEWKTALHWQKSVLESIAERHVESFSYHCPGVIGLEALDKSESICEMINCYSLILQELFVYRSDSLRKFKDPDFFSALKVRAFKNLHLLIHPILWQEEEISLDGLISENIQAYTDKLTHEWNMTKKEYNVS